MSTYLYLRIGCVLSSVFLIMDQSLSSVDYLGDSSGLVVIQDKDNT